MRARQLSPWYLPRSRPSKGPRVKCFELSVTLCMFVSRSNHSTVDAALECLIDYNNVIPDIRASKYKYLHCWTHGLDSSSIQNDSVQGIFSSWIQEQFSFLKIQFWASLTCLVTQRTSLLLCIQGQLKNLIIKKCQYNGNIFGQFSCFHIWFVQHKNNHKRPCNTIRLLFHKPDAKRFMRKVSRFTRFCDFKINFLVPILMEWSIVWLGTNLL